MKAKFIRYAPCIHTSRGSLFKRGPCLALLAPSTGIMHQYLRCLSQSSTCIKGE
jgi:hypothetical protein